VIELHPMTRTHLRAVADLERELFADDPWSERTLREELAGPDRYYLVAQEGTDLVGYGGVANLAGEAHVMTIGVRTDRRRAGLGSLLLAGLLAQTTRWRCTRVLLEVAADNAAAQQLYAKHGFVPIGVRRRYYPATGTDAVVMAREQCGGGEQNEQQ
jgi:[ribosomal protein S18]-alanine N-acetyltransferase